VQPTRQNNNNQNSQDCDYKIWQIKMFVQTYNMDRRNNNLQKQMAESIASEARNLGCSQNAIAAALGDGTSTDGGDYTGGSCGWVWDDGAGVLGTGSVGPPGYNCECNMRLADENYCAGIPVPQPPY
jgi:hypothetical protein